MAKGIYVGVDSKARKVKKAYVGVAENSLVVNGDFSNGLEGWEHTAGRYELQTSVDSCMIAEMVAPGSTTGSITRIYNSCDNVVPNHVYYGRFDMKGETSNQNLTAALEINYTSGNQTICSVSNGYNSADWVSVSKIITPTKEENGTVALRLTAQNLDGTLKAGMKFYFDNVALYDLTALYGAGNEPTLEWCDTNLETLKELYKSKNGKARKVKKGYIGVDEVARLFYSAETLVPFTSNIMPYGWTNSSDYLSATVTDQYGTWRTIASAIDDEDCPISNMFDGDTGGTSRYKPKRPSSDTAYTTTQIFLPAGVTVNPTQIKIWSRYAKNSYLFGIGIDGTLTELGQLTLNSQSYVSTTFNISSDKYYKGFELQTRRYNTSTTCIITEFELISGTLKIE